MTIWKTIPPKFPTDGATIWVRRLPYLSAPFKATWSRAAGTFTETVTGLTLPWYEVNRWRAL